VPPHCDEASLCHAVLVSKIERLSQTNGDNRPNEPRREARGENRFPPAFAVVVAGALYTLLPDTLRPARGSWCLPSKRRC